MAVVQSAYLTRHVGGAVHMLVFAFIHGVCVCVCVCVCPSRHGWLLFACHFFF